MPCPARITLGNPLDILCLANSAAVICVAEACYMAQQQTTIKLLDS